MDLPQLRADARFLISPQLTSAQYTDVACNRNINNWHKRILVWMINDQDTWQMGGQTLNLDLKVNQYKYDAPTPTKLMRIIKVEAKLTNASDYVPCVISDHQRNQDYAEGNITRVVDNAGRPTVDFFGTDLEIRPAPTENVTNGLRIWAQVSFFDLDDVVNRQPQMADALHRALSVGAALDFAISQNLTRKVTQLNFMMYGNPSLRDDKGLKGDIKDLYVNHGAAQRPRLGTRPGNFT